MWPSLSQTRSPEPALRSARKPDRTTPGGLGLTQSRKGVRGPNARPEMRFGHCWASQQWHPRVKIPTQKIPIDLHDRRNLWMRSGHGVSMNIGIIDSWLAKTRNLSHQSIVVWVGTYEKTATPGKHPSAIQVGLPKGHPAPTASQVARDGSSRVLDHDTGLQRI